MNDDTTLQHELDRLASRLPEPPPPARLLAQVARTRTRRRRRVAVAGAGVMMVLVVGVVVARSLIAPAPSPLDIADGTNGTGTSRDSVPVAAASGSAWRAFGRALDWPVSDADPRASGVVDPVLADAAPKLRPFRARDIADLAADLANERRERDEP